MAAESSSGRSSATADSYIGSLISLTSKSEIRYEGILYNINTEESSIGLRNVRSFGTEGRKKDGPQVPPSDKIYEYILFRGSDIKDLQVKSSPPAQPNPPINSDPAIIQSHYPRPTAATTSLPTTVTGSLTDISPHSTPVGHPASTFQGALPLYQPGGNLGTWGPSPPPNASGSALPMPMYWQGFYGTQLPQMHQQSLLRPPPGLSMPPSLQQMQYPGFNSSLPTGTSNLPASNLSDYQSPLMTNTSTTLGLTSTSLPASTLPSAVPPVQPGILASETISGTMFNKSPVSALPATNLGANLPSLTSLSTGPDAIPSAPQMSGKPNPVPSPVLPHPSLSQPVTTAAGASSSVVVETPTPSLVTPGQLLQSGVPAISATQSSLADQKDVEVVQVSPAPASEQLVPAKTEAQPPILPLPPSTRAQKPNGASFQPRHNYRGRGGRGPGISRPVTKFTEDFDFMAMNEKFNKDEVWGSLGKSSRSQAKDGNGSEEDDYQYEDEAEIPKVEVKPVYNKDDFFDSLSCNALDNEPNHGRTRFSEQMKLDAETFGDFARYRGGRVGRGPGRGGRSRGSYYGRGYGYNNYGGRGRGRGVPNRAP